MSIFLFYSLQIIFKAIYRDICHGLRGSGLVKLRARRPVIQIFRFRLVLLGAPPPSFDQLSHSLPSSSSSSFINPLRTIHIAAHPSNFHHPDHPLHSVIFCHNKHIDIFKTLFAKFFLWT